MPEHEASRESLDESLAALELTIQRHLQEYESLKIERDALQVHLAACRAALEHIQVIVDDGYVHDATARVNIRRIADAALAEGPDA